MFQDWLICIFSYNRGAYLENLLASIGQFYPEMHLAVFDDGSDEEETKSILSRMQETSYVYVADKETLGSKHGGLYGNMNAAIAFACKQGYKYAYFIQDDMQFLWRDDELTQRVKNVFERKECMMCNFNFLQKILKGSIHKRLPGTNCAELFLFEKNGIVDTGVIDLEKARLAGLHFPQNSESGNGSYWYDESYRVYWVNTPHLAWVPWPTSYRHKQIEKHKRRFLRPLSSDAIGLLRNKNSYKYLEDYTSLFSFAIKPYWYTANPGNINLLKIYLKYYLGLPI